MTGATCSASEELDSQNSLALGRVQSFLSKES